MILVPINGMLMPMWVGGGTTISEESWVFYVQDDDNGKFYEIKVSEEEFDQYEEGDMWVR